MRVSESPQKPVFVPESATIRRNLGTYEGACKLTEDDVSNHTQKYTDPQGVCLVPLPDKIPVCYPSSRFFQFS
jgi:hypothetical protein